MKKTSSNTLLPLQVGRQDITAIRVSITNQHGQRQCYCAQDVNFKIQNGEVQVVQNEKGCFVWFDQCDLVLREGSIASILRLKSGAASKREGEGISIIADFNPADPVSRDGEDPLLGLWMNSSLHLSPTHIVTK